MNYAEEQLQNAIENESKVLKSRNKELVAMNERLLVEKDCLFKIKEKALEEMHEYKQANILLGDFRQELEDKINKLKSYISELEYQSMEQTKKEDELNNIIENYRLGIKNANVVIAEFTGKEIELQNKIEKLKKTVKDLASLL